MKNYIIPITLAIAFISFNGCKKEEGCMDATAINYNSDAEKDDGSCLYWTGCTDPSALNYDPDATQDDGSCSYSGKVVFWTQAGDGIGYVAIQIESSLIGTITQDATSTPNCGDNGMVTYTDVPGTYNLIAQEDTVIGIGRTWTGTVIITSNGCSAKRLTP